MDKEVDKKEVLPADIPSADRRITRTEFLKKVIVAGGVASAPLIVDKFLVQPAAAGTAGKLSIGGAGGP